MNLNKQTRQRVAMRKTVISSMVSTLFATALLPLLPTMAMAADGEPIVVAQAAQTQSSVPTGGAAAPAGKAPAAQMVAEKPAIEVITVTARKYAEELQTVPISVSAFTKDSLERAKIVAAPDLQFSIPNAVLTGNDRFTIRGIGNNSLGGDNGVGLTVNGASIAYLPQDEFYDLERIEVLRGPQGTLFGRNTTGGGISVNTKRPTNVQSGNLEVETGNFGATRFGGTLNIPVTENLSQRFAGYSLKRNGFTKNLFTGNSVDGRNQYGFRSSTKLDLGNSGQFNLMVGVYDENSSRTRESKRLCKAIPVLGCSPNELAFDSPDATATVLQTLARFFTPFPAGGNIYAGAPNPTNLREIAADFDATYKLKHQFGTFDYTVDLGDFEASYVAGYSDLKTEQNTDWDNAALPFRFTRPITYNMSRDVQVTTDRLLTTDSFVAKSQTQSHELRATTHFKGIFNVTGGLFYLSSKGSGGFFIWHPAIEYFQKANGRPPETWFVNGETLRSTTVSKAAFGEGEFKFSDQLRATVGARYSQEDKSSIGRNIVLTASQPFKESTLSWKWWTGRASIDYSPDKDSMIYSSIATGYKGGGFNAANSIKPEFSPETVTAYEIGYKKILLDGKMRANFSLFYNDYKDMQLAQRIAGSAITSNAAAKISGAEAEIMWAPTKAWLLDTNLSLLRTRIGDFLTVDAANPAQSLTIKTPEVLVNLSGRELPHSPTKKVKVGAQYSMPLFDSGWNTTLRTDYVWQAGYFAREFNTVTDKIKPWGVMNLQWRFARADNNLLIKTFIKNVSNKNNITNIIIEDALIGSYRNVRLLDPRTYGVTMELKF